MLADAGIPLGNQSVLCGASMIVSMSCAAWLPVWPGSGQALLHLPVRPDAGISHFRTCVSKGIEIIEGLRGHVSGFCVPTFVVDALGGGGKIPVMPDYLISQSPERVVLRNYEGVISTYTQPRDYSSQCHCPVCSGEEEMTVTGVSGLLEGQGESLEVTWPAIRDVEYVGPDSGKTNPSD